MVMILVKFLFRSIALVPILGADPNSFTHNKSNTPGLLACGPVWAQIFLQLHIGKVTNSTHFWCIISILCRLLLPCYLVGKMTSFAIHSWSSGVPFCVRVNSTKIFCRSHSLIFSNAMITLPQVNGSLTNKIHMYYEWEHDWQKENKTCI